MLLPGMGVVHNRPLYELTGRRKSASEIVINFPTSGQKLNYRFLQTLRKLLEQVHRPVRFRFFPAVLNQNNGYMPFLAEVQQALGRTSAILDVNPFLGYAEYMGLHGGRRSDARQLSLRRLQHGGGQPVRAPADGGVAGGQMVQPHRRGDDAPRRHGRIRLRHAKRNTWRNHCGWCTTTRWREELTNRLAAPMSATPCSTTPMHPRFAARSNILIANHDRLKMQPGRKPVRIL